MRRAEARVAGRSGQAAVVIAMALPIAVLIIGSCVDLARVWAVRAELQSAADAAALAGVDGATAWATIVVRLERVVCRPPAGGGLPACASQAEERTLSGAVSSLEGGAWRSPAGCGVGGWTCVDARVEQTWAVLADHAGEEAAAMFQVDAEGLTSAGVGVGAPSIRVDGAAARVSVAAQAAVPTVFARVLGRPSVEVTVAGTAVARSGASDFPLAAT